MWNGDIHTAELNSRFTRTGLGFGIQYSKCSTNIKYIRTEVY